MRFGIGRWHGLPGRCFTADSTYYDEQYECNQSVSWYCISIRGMCITRIGQKLRFDVNAVEPKLVRQAVIVPLGNLK